MLEPTFEEADGLGIRFSKFIQNFRTLNVFGKFLLIVKIYHTRAIVTGGLYIFYLIFSINRGLYYRPFMS